MELVFTMSVVEFENVQNVQSVKSLMENYDVAPMQNEISLMGFYMTERKTHSSRSVGG